MSRKFKKVFAVMVVLCLAFVVAGFFLCAHIAAKQGEEATNVSTTPAPPACVSGTVTVSVRIARVIQISGNGTIRSNAHAVMQMGDRVSTVVSQ